MAKEIPEISDKEMKSLLPDQILGWKMQEDNFYDPETIFDYINGAGEVYRAYNFKLLLARRYSREAQPDIFVDLFHMGSGEDAFGVFTHDREGEEIPIGQGAVYKGGLLSFWKDCYFVSLYSEEETVEAKKALFSMGEKIAQAIPGESALPRIVSLLPEKDLNCNRVHYFHNHLILNYHYFVADQNILLLDQETEAVLAFYGDKDKTVVLVVDYHSPEKAREAYQSFRQNYLPDAEREALVLTENNRWTRIEQQESLVVVVFDAISREAAGELISEVLAKQEKFKLPK